MNDIEEHVVEIDPQNFTDTERQLILEVVARDETIRIQERSRLDCLKEDLRNLKEKGVPDDEDELHGRVCKRCRTPLGFIFNSGALCPSCQRKVCKQCRILPQNHHQVKYSWLCTVCSKFRDIRAESGAWFYGNSGQPIQKKKKVYGSLLMKRIFSIAKKRDTVIYKDPVWNGIIEEETLEDEDDGCDNDYLLITSNNVGEITLREVSTEEIKPNTNGHVAKDIESELESQSVDEQNPDYIISEFTAAEETEKEMGDEYMSEESEDEYISSATVVSGEVMIGLKYDENESIFEVQVHRAKDLIVADSNKKVTDPYVKVYLTSNVRSLGKKKTKAKKNTLNPEFDEVLIFKMLGRTEMITCTCNISVWHYDFYNSNIHLGDVEINIQEYCDSGFSLESPIPQWYTLCSKKVNPTQLTFSGNLIINLQYKAPGSQIADSKREQRKLPDPAKGQLMVYLIQAKDLKDADPLAAFYCKMSLVTETEMTKYTSKHVSGSGNPLWEEEFIFDNIAWKDLETSFLQLSVRGKVKSSVFYGGARLGLGKLKGLKHDSFGEEVKVWKSMLDRPNESQDFIIPLRSSLDSVKQDMVVPPKPVKEITNKQLEKMVKKRDSLTSTTSIAKRFLNSDTISLASSGSMLSLYSNAGGEHGDLVISGEILFSIKHDNVNDILSIHIEKAKGIAAASLKQMTSDPYVKVYLLPDKAKTSKKKTTHRRKTLNPQWKETIKYQISRDEVMKKTLQVSIWNHDRFGRNDFLGEVQVNIKHYSSTNNLDIDTPVWYTLQELAPVSVGGADDNKGELKVGIRFDHEILSVTIKQANGLYAVNPDKLPNPFVKCYLLPDKSRKSKRKTGIQKKTISPVWNEKFDYKNIEVNDLYSRVLEITVWDHDSSGHQFLGGARLGLPQGDEYWHDCFGKEVQLWEGMMKHLGILAEYAIPLRATMTSRKGQEIPMITAQVEENDISEFLDPVEGPCIFVSLQYLDAPDDPQKKKKKGTLKVHLKEGKNLPTDNDEDVPSSYCKGFIHPKKKGLKMKTETYIKSANPLWDTEMVFDGLMLDELRTKGLEIIVYDEISEKKSEIIGYIRLGSGGNTDKWDDSSGCEIEIWNSMLNNPGQTVMRAVPLRLPLAKVEPEIDFYENEYSDIEDEAYVEVDTAQGNDGSESPRTSALRAMGAHAANVIELMNRETEVYESEPMGESSLTTIKEEGEISPEDSLKTSLPQITVTSEDQYKEILEPVKADDTPFPEPRMDIEDDFNEDYSFKEKKKKKNPSFSLLKKSTSTESLSSIYSTDSANIYDQVPIRGEIQFGMKYDYTANNFEVHIFQARDIAAADTKKEISDPYVKVYLLPDKTKRGKKKTTIRKKTLCPEWEEILEFKITLRDLRTRTLWISIWHQERFGRNIFLGEVMQNMDVIIDDGDDLEMTSPKWHQLCGKGTAPSTELYKGELKFSIMFEDKTLFGSKRNQGYEELSSKKKKKKKKKEDQAAGKINLHIKEAYDLPSADKDGFSDPFCKCNLLPQSSKTKRKTPVIRHTLNPIWDYKLEYDCDYEDLAERGIEFVVWDWDRNSRNDFLGCFRISLGTHTDTWDDARGIEIDAWQHVIDHPNVWKEFVIPLRSKIDYRPNNVMAMD